MNDLAFSLRTTLTLANGTLVDIDEALRQRPVFLIGSDARSNLVVADAAASHAQISRTQDGYFVRAVRSGLPLEVNGRPVDHLLRLNSGDLIQVGAVELKFVQGETNFSASVPLAAAPAQPLIRKPVPAPTTRQVDAVEPSAEPVIYFPPTGSRGGPNALSLLSGFTVIAVIVGILGFAIFSNLAPRAVQADIAFASEGVTLVMFTADW